MIYLISPQDVKDKTPIQGVTNDKEKKLIAAIEMAHFIVKPLICDNLYNEMVEAYNGGNPSDEEEALYPYLVNYLVWQSFNNYLGFSQFTDTDAGFRVFTEPNSLEAKPVDIGVLQKNAQSFITVYESELLSFLNTNKNDYPSWVNSSCYKCRTKGTFLGISSAGKKRYRERNNLL